MLPSRPSRARCIPTRSPFQIHNTHHKRTCKRFTKWSARKVSKRSKTGELNVQLGTECSVWLCTNVLNPYESLLTNMMDEGNRRNATECNEIQFETMLTVNVAIRWFWQVEYGTWRSDTQPRTSGTKGKKTWAAPMIGNCLSVWGIWKIGVHQHQSIVLAKQRLLLHDRLQRYANLATTVQMPCRALNCKCLSCAQQKDKSWGMQWMQSAPHSKTQSIASVDAHINLIHNIPPIPILDNQPH